jgi:hypothetical protein
VASPEDTTPTPPAQKQSRRRGHVGNRAWIVVAAAVIVALVAVMLLRTGVATASRPVGDNGVSSHWQTYHDPLGLFTLRLPPGWSAHVTVGTLSYGGPIVKLDDISFSNPSQGSGSASVGIFADPIATTVEQQYYCDASSAISGFSPMTVDRLKQMGAYVIFVTEGAHFQIDVKIPGILAPATFGQPPYPTPTPTALPASWLATDVMQVNALLASFQPMDPKPLEC